VPAITIAHLYKQRWQVELFFRWIKQHLRIKSFFGYSANAVKTQVWIALSVYALLAIVKKQLKIEVSLYTFLQVISVSIFEKTPISQLFQTDDYKNNSLCVPNQLFLFDL
jgi:IS4 transposase